MDGPDAPPAHRQAHTSLVLTDTEASILSALDEAGIGFVWSEGEHILHANQAIVRMTGFRREELLAMSDPFLLLPEPDRSRLRETMRDRIEGKHAPSTIDTSVRRKDEDYFPARITVRTVARSVRGIEVIALVRDRAHIPRPREPRAIVEALLAVIGPAHVALEQAGTRFARSADARDIPSALAAFEELGLGALELQKREGARFDFVGTGLAGKQPSAESPCCAIATGYLVGLVERFEGVPALGAHVECARRGDPACRFIVMQRPR